MESAIDEFKKKWENGTNIEKMFFPNSKKVKILEELNISSIKTRYKPVKTNAKTININFDV